MKFGLVNEVTDSRNQGEGEGGGEEEVPAACVDIQYAVAVSIHNVIHIFRDLRTHTHVYQKRVYSFDVYILMRRADEFADARKST